MEDYSIHQDLQQAQQKYTADIAKAKIDHWNSFLEDAGEADIWMANKYLSSPVGDGGKTRIPMLKVKGSDGLTKEANTNKEKAKSLAEAFFPPKPAMSLVPQGYNYPSPLPSPPPVTEAQILTHITKLALFKAPGPDRIPNIVLQRAALLIVPCLLPRPSIIKDGFYHRDWQESTTYILWKVGKVSYEVPKSYCPIALLCTMAKVLTSIVAETLTMVMEQHQLLPDSHFRGRPCRSTTDAVHLLVHKVKDAWRKKKVALILFLDIEGAFPNTVTDWLLYNMKKR